VRSSLFWDREGELTAEICNKHEKEESQACMVEYGYSPLKLTLKL
jgi:hypothetical protein